METIMTYSTVAYSTVTYSTVAYRFSGIRYASDEEVDQQWLNSASALRTGYQGSDSSASAPIAVRPSER